VEATLFIFGIVSLIFFYPSSILADVSGLLPCGDSFLFAKRLDREVQQLMVRLSNYDSGSPGYIDLKGRVEQTKDRFYAYSRRGLLCGEEGLPHLIVDGRWSHAGEFILPGILFLYISGWIGWSGRRYLSYSRKLSNFSESEYIIHVPVALFVMFSSVSWPVSVLKTWNEFTVLDEEITVSMR
jgi:photosystem I subunit 3